MYSLSYLIWIISLFDFSLVLAAESTVSRKELVDARYSPLERAEQAVIQNNQEALRTLLLQGAFVNQIPTSRVPLLFRAAGDRHWGLVNELLNRGALFEVMDTQGWYSIMDYLAGMDGDHTYGLDFFRKKGASIRGPTAVQKALIVDRIRGRYLAQGKDIDVKTYASPHPLLSALRVQNRTHVEWLLKHGADPNLEDSRGYPLQVVVQNEDTESLELLLKAGITLWLPIDGGGFAPWLKKLWKVTSNEDWSRLPEKRAFMLGRLKAYGFHEPIE